ncbi:MAG: hypothetical protein HPM95_15880 [Alphaproteobacteria bacterium]|nr:hypothetical protein [Alphaproteobacteria bacterium]
MCRPPGHHAGRRFFGGYCFLNNAALAALALRRQTRARVAVIDIDYHAGNGTTDCLAAHPDIAVFSCHARARSPFRISRIWRRPFPHMCFMPLTRRRMRKPIWRWCPVLWSRPWQPAPGCWCCRSATT